MHTIVEDANGWSVVRLETATDGQTSYTVDAVMFTRMSFGGALALCSALNGGALPDGAPLSVWAACSVNRQKGRQ